MPASRPGSGVPAAARVAPAAAARAVGRRLRALPAGVALAAAAIGVAAAPAAAAPTDVTLRVEGRSATLYEGPLRTSGAAVDGGDGTGAHACGSGGSPASALAASGLTWHATWGADFQDFFLDRVGPDGSDPQTASYWSVLVDWRYSSGICSAGIASGAEVLLAYGPGSRLLRLTGPTRVAVGEPLTVSVRDGWIRGTTGADGGPVAGATVASGAAGAAHASGAARASGAAAASGADGVSATTGADGRAIVRFETSGLKRLKATAADAIRSNTLTICVGDERCAGAPLPPTPADPGQPAPPSGPGSPPPDTDARRAPSIAVPAAGERYARGGSPLRVEGAVGEGAVAAAASVVTGVKASAGASVATGAKPSAKASAAGTVALRLGGRRGRSCVELTRGGHVAARPCARRPDPVTVTVRDGRWSQRIAGRLPPGRYRLEAGAGSAITVRRFTVAASPANARAATPRATRWLARTQAADGAFGMAAGGPPVPLVTDWAAAALGRSRTGEVAYRRALGAVRRAPRRDLAALERAALALAPSSRAADRRRLRAAQAAIVRRQAANGSWGGQVNATAYALVALRGGERTGAARAATSSRADDRAARTARPRETIRVKAIRAGERWLRRQPLARDADTVGAVLWALGRGAPRVAALARLRAVQAADGGFASGPGMAANAQSTALAVLGLEAAGVRARTVRSAVGISGVDYLRARQDRSGRVAYARGDARTPTWVTAQALLALTAAAR